MRRAYFDLRARYYIAWTMKHDATILKLTVIIFIARTIRNSIGGIPIGKHCTASRA